MKHSTSFILFGFLLGIASSSLGASVLGSSVFPDVKSGTYFDAAVGDMYSAGIITGYADGRFGPSDYVTRGQIAVIMQRFRNDLLGIETPPPSPPQSSVRSSTAPVQTSVSSAPASSQATSSPAQAAGEAGSLRFAVETSTVNEDEGPAKIGVTRTGGAKGSVTVKYEVTEGTASSGLDFAATKGTIEFGDGQSSKMITVAITDDNAIEDEDETVTIILKEPSGGAVLTTPSTMTLSIVDDDGAQSTQTTTTSQNGVFNFSAMEYRVPDDGSALTVTVERSGGTNGGVSVAYATSNNTATGDHYTGVSGTLQFAEGETSKTFTVTVTNNTTINGNKKFGLTLSNPSGGAILGDTATSDVVIVDNEVASFGVGSLKFTEEEYLGSEFQQRAVVFVERAGGAKGDVSITYATQASSAQSGVDYTETSGTLTFRSGESLKRIIVPVLRDGLNDANEHFSIKLSNPTGGATLASPSSASITIQ